MNYKVSVIIPVYNVENYLDETINSVLEQDINFEKNVELILVNDGSKDNSEKICLKYKEKYPNNIKYIYKDNSGVSETRNLGYKNSHGKYIMFLDSDDKINKKSLRLTSKFLDSHEEAGFVISRVRFFDAMSKWHYMDFRFKSRKKIVDINKDIRYCQYHSTGILIRRELLKNIKFDKTIKFGEDMKFMSEILFENPIFGIEKRSILYYRKRQEETSAVQTQFKNKSYYLTTMKDSFKYILNKAKRKYGEIPLYFKHYIMNSICERLLLKAPVCDVNEVLNEKEFKEYIKCFKDILKEMDDVIILNQHRLSMNHKYYLLKVIHGDNYKIDARMKSNFATFNGMKFKTRNTDICKIFDMKKDKNDMVFYICLNEYIFNVKVLCNGQEAKLKEITDVEDPPNEIYHDLYFKPFYKEKMYEVRYNFKGFKKLEVFANNNKVVLFPVRDAVAHNALPIKDRKVSNKIIVIKKNTVIAISKCIKIRSLFFKIRNILYIINRDGLSMTIDRFRGKI